MAGRSQAERLSAHVFGGDSGGLVTLSAGVRLPWRAVWPIARTGLKALCAPQVTFSSQGDGYRPRSGQAARDAVAVSSLAVRGRTGGA